MPHSFTQQKSALNTIDKRQRSERKKCKDPKQCWFVSIWANMFCLHCLNELWSNGAREIYRMLHVFLYPCRCRRVSAFFLRFFLCRFVNITVMCACTEREEEEEKKTTNRNYNHYLPSIWINHNGFKFRSFREFPIQNLPSLFPMPTVFSFVLLSVCVFFSLLCL